MVKKQELKQQFINTYNEAPQAILPQKTPSRSAEEYDVLKKKNSKLKIALAVFAVLLFAAVCSHVTPNHTKPIENETIKEEATSNTDTDPDPVQKSIEVVSITDSTVTLSWAKEDGVSAYFVYKADEKGNYIKISETVDNEITVKDLMPKKEYTIIVMSEKYFEEKDNNGDQAVDTDVFRGLVPIVYKCVVLTSEENMSADSSTSSIQETTVPVTVNDETTTDFIMR